MRYRALKTESLREKGACVSHCWRSDPRARPFRHGPRLSQSFSKHCARQQTHSLACSPRRDPRRGAAARTRSEVAVHLLYVRASTRASAHVAGSDRAHSAAGLGAAATTIDSSRRVAASRARRRARGPPPRPACCPWLALKRGAATKTKIRRAAACFEEQTRELDPCLRAIVERALLPLESRHDLAARGAAPTSGWRACIGSLRPRL